MVELSRRAIPYTPNPRRLSEMTIALVSTAGVHLKDQEPFETGGDDSYRVIPGDAAAGQFTITHGAPKEHYDPTDALRDINCMFPIDRLRELADRGEIGGVTTKHFTLMGYSLKLRKFIEETTPVLAKEVDRSKADGVLLTAG